MHAGIKNFWYFRFDREMAINFIGNASVTAHATSLLSRRRASDVHIGAALTRPLHFWYIMSFRHIQIGSFSRGVVPSSGIGWWYRAIAENTSYRYFVIT